MYTDFYEIHNTSDPINDAINWSEIQEELPRYICSRNKSMNRHYLEMSQLLHEKKSIHKMLISSVGCWAFIWTSPSAPSIKSDELSDASSSTSQ